MRYDPARPLWLCMWRLEVYWVLHEPVLLFLAIPPCRFDKDDLNADGLGAIRIMAWDLRCLDVLNFECK